MARERYKYAGMTVKTKQGVGHGLNGASLEGVEFTIEDWFSNVIGTSWMFADGSPTAILYALRIADFGKNNGIPIIDDDVLYGKVNGLGFAFNVKELELPEE